MDVALSLLLGIALGAATGIPLGVLNVALVEAAVRVGRRHALGIGVGGAVADGAHAGLAFAGAAALITGHDDARRALVAVSLVVVVAYAAWVWRRPAMVAPPTPGLSGMRVGFGRGVGVGILLTLPNPVPLLAWVAVAGIVVPEPSPASAAAGALGVVAGSAACFSLLAVLASGGRLDRAGRWLPRAVAALLVGFGLIAAARVL